MEDKVIQSYQTTTITTTWLGNIEAIIKNHYNEILSRLPDTQSRNQAQILLEDMLIVNGSRVSLDSKIITDKGIAEKLLTDLVATHIIRAEQNTLKGISYEISHDTLVTPIQESGDLRRAKEAKERKEKAEKERLERLLLERKRQQKVIIMVGSVAVVARYFCTFRKKGLKLKPKSKPKLLKKKNTVQIVFTMRHKRRLTIFYVKSKSAKK